MDPTSHDIVPDDLGVVCTMCGVTGLDTEDLVRYSPECLRYGGHYWVPMLNTNGYHCTVCPMTIPYSSLCKRHLVAMCPSYMTNNPISSDLFDIGLSVESPWTHGHCQRCDAEICPPLDGDGAVECSRCQRV